MASRAATLGTRKCDGRRSTSPIAWARSAAVTGLGATAVQELLDQPPTYEACASRDENVGHRVLVFSLPPSRSGHSPVHPRMHGNRIPAQNPPLAVALGPRLASCSACTNERSVALETYRTQSAAGSSSGAADEARSGGRLSQVVSDGARFATRSSSVAGAEPWSDPHRSQVAADEAQSDAHWSHVAADEAWSAARRS